VLGAGAFAGYPIAAGLLSFVGDFNTLEARTKEIAQTSQFMPEVS